MRTRKGISPDQPRGFTIVELIIGSSILLVVVLGALVIYSRSNKVSVEQQMVTEVQSDVRAGMFFITRDLRMAGVGLAEEFAGFFIEGWDNEDQGGGAEVNPDRIRLMGNIEDPLNLTILNYFGAAAEVSVEDYNLEQYPYPDEFYVNKTVIVLPNPESGCVAGAIRTITHVTHSATGTNESVNFSPGLAPGIDPPGGLSDTCPNSSDFNGGSMMFVDVKEYWLDVTGNAVNPVSGEALVDGVNGYIGGGVGGVFYVTHNAVHFPLARNIENFQIEYDGDMDGDQILDGWSPWQEAWRTDPVARARLSQVRIWLLGRTARAFTSVSGTPPAGIHLYRRPLISNSPAAAQDDLHKRFLLESMSNVRNMSLSLYNTGQR